MNLRIYFGTAAFILGVVSFIIWLKWSPSEQNAIDHHSLGVSAEVETFEPVAEIKKTQSVNEVVETRLEEFESGSSLDPDETSASENSNAYEGRLTVDRSLELAFSTNAAFADIHRELTEGIDAEFPMLEGTFEELGINEQGFLHTTYISLNGEEVNQWYDENGNIVAEEINFPGGESSLTRWYKPESGSIEKVMVSGGEHYGLIEFDSTSRPIRIAFADPNANVKFDIEE